MYNHRTTPSFCPKTWKCDDFDSWKVKLSEADGNPTMATSTEAPGNIINLLLGVGRGWEVLLSAKSCHRSYNTMS